MGRRQNHPKPVLNMAEVPTCKSDSRKFRLRAVLQGKLASMHMRRAHAAVLAVWRMEVRCRRRLTVLAERLTAAAAQRRMRAAFLAWFKVVLTPDPPAARVPGKVSFVHTSLTVPPLEGAGYGVTQAAVAAGASNMTIDSSEQQASTSLKRCI